MLFAWLSTAEKTSPQSAPSLAYLWRSPDEAQSLPDRATFPPLLALR